MIASLFPLRHDDEIVLPLAERNRQNCTFTISVVAFNPSVPIKLPLHEYGSDPHVGIL